jgi:hypothetical protein
MTTSGDVCSADSEENEEAAAAGSTVADTSVFVNNGDGGGDEQINVVDDLEESKFSESSEEHEHEPIDSLNGSSSPPASKCGLCGRPYENALVSVNCWHVHCKQCWSKSLAGMKSCKINFFSKKIIDR